MRLALSLPPSVNHYLRHTRNGTYKTQDAKSWQASSGYLARRWWGQREPLAQKLVLRCWVYWPDNRRRDCDNLTKCLADALTGIVWADDCYVLPQYMDYQVDKKNPRIEVEVEVKE